jgi:hypothetical protein
MTLRGVTGAGARFEPIAMKRFFTPHINGI